MKTLRYVGYIIVALWIIFILSPIYWVIVTSFKLPVDVYQGPLYLPFVDFVPSLHAWRGLVADPKTWQVFTNTITVGLVSSFASLVIGSLAAYGLARFQFRFWHFGNKDIAFWIISTKITLPAVIMLPFFIMYNSLQMLDTRIGLIMAYVGFNLPFVVWIMRDHFANIPRELEESALIDGASILYTFFLIVIPLTLPGLIGSFLISLILSWNEFLFAFILTFEEAQTLPVWIVAKNSMAGAQWWDISALALLAISPLILLAILTGRFITEGLLTGALKQ